MIEFRSILFSLVGGMLSKYLFELYIYFFFRFFIGFGLLKITSSMNDEKSKDHCYHRLSVIFDDFFKFLCVIGLLVQISYVLIRYFDFDYLTHVQFIIPNETQLPDVFICSNFLAFLNYTLLFQRYPYLINSLSLSRNQMTERSIKEQILARMSLEEASLVITSSLNMSQVTDCLLPLDFIFGTLDIKTNFTMNVQDLCGLNLYYRKFYLCFVFNCSRNGPVIVSNNDFYKDPVETELFLLRMRHSVFVNTDFFFIGTNLPSTFPVSPTYKMDVQIIEGYPRAFRYHLKTVEVNLLPPPYPTSCKDYSEIKSNFTSRGGIIDNCLTDLSIKSINCPHLLSLQGANWNLRFASECYQANNDNITFRKLMNSIVDDCFHQNSQPDCSRILYFLQGRSPVSIQGNFSTLVIDETKEPNIIVDYEPKTTWLDCLVQIGSVLGTWFGFSILSHIPIISRFVVHQIHDCVTCSFCSQSKRKVKRQLKRDLTPSGYLRKDSRVIPNSLPVRYMSPDRTYASHRSLFKGHGSSSIRSRW